MWQRIKQLTAKLGDLIWQPRSSGLLSKAADAVNSRAFAYLCALFCLLCIGIQLMFCFSPFLWGDPAATLCIIDRSYGEIVSLTATDVHPPLYYFIVRAFIDLATFIAPSLSTITAGKMASVVPFFIMLLLCMTVVRKRWGWYAAGMGSLAVVGVSPLIEFGTEIRMYGWATLFVTACYIYAYEFIKKKSLAPCLLFTAAGLCAAYTHTFACLAVMPIYLCVGIISFGRGKKCFSLWLAACIITVLGYLPWLHVLINQTSTAGADFWIKEPTFFQIYVALVRPYEWINIVSSISLPALSNSLSVLITGISFICVLTLFRKRNLRHRRALAYGICGISVYLFTMLIALLVTWFVFPVFVERYFIPGFVCCWLGIIIIARLSKGSLFQLLCLGLLVISTMHQLKRFLQDENQNRHDAARLIQYLNQESESAILTTELGCAIPINVMLDKPVFLLGREVSKTWVQLAFINPGRGILVRNEAELLDLLKSGKRIIYIGSKQEQETLSQSPSLPLEPVKLSGSTPHCGPWTLYRVLPKP